jgi:hypothetical protein
MNRKKVLNALKFAVLASTIVAAFLLYFDLYNRLTGLESDYDSLLDEHELLQTSNDELEANLQSLNEAYANFTSDYNQLNESYQSLISDYTELKQSLTEMSIDYTPIFNNYTMLLEAFNMPLSYEEVPTVEELKQWLATDKTDELEYTEPNFICGDFATMLSQHAKMNNWDMGVVAVFGRKTDTKDFAHAINAIVCKEGLVYIEPQTDEVWWIRNYREIPENSWSYFPGFGSVYVEQHSIIVWYE